MIASGDPLGPFDHMDLSYSQGHSFGASLDLGGIIEDQFPLAPSAIES